MEKTMTGTIDDKAFQKALLANKFALRNHVEVGKFVKHYEQAKPSQVTADHLAKNDWLQISDKANSIAGCTDGANCEYCARDKQTVLNLLTIPQQPADQKAMTGMAWHPVRNRQTKINLHIPFFLNGLDIQR